MSDKAEPFNILFVTPAFVFGGLERVILDLLRELDRSRFRPLLSSLYPPVPEMAQRIAALDVPFFPLDKGDGVNPRLVGQLARIMREQRVDLVNAHDIGATFYAAPAARWAGVRRVIHTDHSQILGIRRRLWAFGAVLRYGVTLATTVSDDLRNFLVEKIGMRPDRVMTLPNGIDLAACAPKKDRETVRRELGFAPGDRLIGAIGRLVEQKGMAYLIQALRAVRAAFPSARVLVIGDGPLREELKAEAERLELGEAVTLAGIREDIPDLLGAMDVFALPSLWEGQPLVLIEAMAARTPIVSSDVGGCAEILKYGRFGLLVPPGDPGALAGALRTVLSEPEPARRRAEAALAHAQAELSHTAMAHRYESVFESLLEQGE